MSVTTTANTFHWHCNTKNIRRQTKSFHLPRISRLKPINLTLFSNFNFMSFLTMKCTSSCEQWKYGTITSIIALWSVFTILTFIWTFALWHCSRVSYPFRDDPIVLRVMDVHFTKKTGYAMRTRHTRGFFSDRLLTKFKKFPAQITMYRTSWNRLFVIKSKWNIFYTCTHYKFCYGNRARINIISALFFFFFLFLLPSPATIIELMLGSR